jgi:hypothetical protein
MHVFLKTVSRPGPHSRSHVTLCTLKGPLFRGDSIDAPSYCCGHCGAVLIEGVESDRFAEADKLILSSEELVDLMPGDYVARSTLVASGSTTIVSFNGPLVVTCSLCYRSNEMTFSDGPGAQAFAFTLG